MHMHGREFIELVAIVLVAVVAAVWYIAGRGSASKPPPDSK